MTRLSIIPGRAVTDDRLSPAHFRTLALLCTYTNSEDDSCYPSQKTIAERMGFSRQYVNRLIGDLCSLGYVEKEGRRRDNGSDTSCSYRVLYDQEEVSTVDDTVCQQEVTGGVNSRSLQGVSTTEGDTHNASPERLSLTDISSAREETTLALEAYNATAEQIGLPKAQKLTDARKSKLKARLKDCGGLEGWNYALMKVRENPFLCGDNSRGWRVDFDFLLTQSRFVKLMEGGYDQRPHDARKQGHGSRIGSELDALHSSGLG